MRKGQVKLLEKAEKYGFSERKKNYLAEADKPLSFLNNIFWFLYFHSDDEMGDYSILEEINLFLIELREKECLNCSFSYKQVPVDDIRKIFHSRFSVYEKFHMLCHMDHGYSYEEVCIISEYGDDKNPNCYHSVLNTTDKNGVLVGKELHLKISYALYFASKYNNYYDIEKFKRVFMKYAFSHNVPLDDAVKYDFSYEHYSKNRFCHYLPQLAALYQLDDKNEYTDIYWHRPELYQSIITFIQNVGQDVKLEVDGKITKIIVQVTANAVKISFYCYKTIYAKGNDIMPCTYNKKEVADIIVFFDGYMYENISIRGVRKCIPLTIAHIQKYRQLFGKPFQTFISATFSERIKNGDYLFQDLSAYLSKHNSFFIPITYNECIGKKNFNHLLREKYPASDFINWNKTDIGQGYLILKSLTWVEKGSVGILKETKNNAFLLDDGFKRNDLIISYLSTVILSFLDPDTYWKDEENKMVSDLTVVQTIKDYVRMAHSMKQKVNLKFRSAKKLKEAHDDIFVLYSSRNTPLVKIPKKTVFLKLRTILPEEFEWIKSRRRILLEGKNMHHCVASYAGDINRDNCAIYSFLYSKTGKRYTIEFKHSKGNYWINQIQGMCNRGCPTEVWDYVKSFLVS